MMSHIAYTNLPAAIARNIPGAAGVTGDGRRALSAVAVNAAGSGYGRTATAAHPGRKAALRARKTAPLTALAVVCGLLASVANAMVPMDEGELADITGQALFVSDTIAANGIAGDPANFTFFRMGLDAEVALNANIDKLQLGCGGFNNAIAGNACDIDIDFFRLMGRNGSNAGAAVTSDFTLLRPFVELAIKNEGTATLREVAGFKLGAQNANGFLGFGRTFSNGQFNPDVGATCNGGNDIDCHSGLNRFSGLMNFRFAGTVSGDICALGANPGCSGFLNFSIGDFEATFDSPGQIAGSRLTNALLSTTTTTEASVIGIPLTIEPTVEVDQALRFIHGIAIVDTPDFFISFQREPIAFPTFDKTGSSVATNVGWWMNVPGGAELLGLQGTTTLSSGQAIGGLIGFTINLPSLDLGQTPPQNCFGTVQFC